MELWFTENHTDNIRFSIKVKQHLYSEKSRYQQIDILDSEELGRILVLDGFVMLTEKDEYIYHEMITHADCSAPVVPGAERYLTVCKYSTFISRQPVREQPFSLANAM